MRPEDKLHTFDPNQSSSHGGGGRRPNFRGQQREGRATGRAGSATARAPSADIVGESNYRRPEPDSPRIKAVGVYKLFGEPHLERVYSSGGRRSKNHSIARDEPIPGSQRRRVAGPAGFEPATPGSLHGGFRRHARTTDRFSMPYPS